VRICLVYDCLFPWTIGGAERWYRNLAERLVADGHEVTYLTRRQWEPGDEPRIPGVRVVAVSPGGDLYGEDGNRRMGPPLRFGAGVLRHLLRHGRDYDVVHTASFPYFSVLAAAAARWRWRGRGRGRAAPYRIVVDWHEVWSRAYWTEYLGGAAGLVGYAVQRLCVWVPQRAFCFSRLFRDRLRAEGLRGDVTVLEGEYAGDLTPPAPRPASRTVVFAGRHIAEKRAPAVVAGIARARERGLDVRGLILGDGPERPLVLEAIAAHGLEGVVEAPGFVDAAVVAAALDDALCLLHPSSREGYGLVVVEACAHGTPTVVVTGEDNAAVELIAPGENGFVAPSADADDLADALLAVDAAGLALRERTCAWFTANARRLSLEGSLDAVAAAYAGDSAPRGSAATLAGVSPEPAPADPLDAVPAWKATAAKVVRHAPASWRAAYMRWARGRRRARRRAAEAQGREDLSRPALYDMEAKLLRHLEDQRGGFFVEAGANDGFEQSNTYYLERFRGWTGLLVEPVPHLHAEAVTERPGATVLQRALVAPDDDGTSIEMRYGGLMTVVAGSKGSTEADAEYVAQAFALGLEDEMTFTVQGRTLSALLDEVGAAEIDLLSLDLEGYEPAALRGLDLDRHVPRFVLVEVRDMPAGLEPIAAVLGDRYAFVEALSPYDALYRRVD